MLDERTARTETNPFAISQLNRIVRQRMLAATAAVTIAFSCLVGIKAQAATFREMNEQVIIMEGKIQVGDDSRFGQLLLARNSRGLGTQAILLNSPGGFLQPASVMANAIRLMNMTTVVASYDHCTLRVC